MPITHRFTVVIRSAIGGLLIATTNGCAEHRNSVLPPILHSETEASWGEQPSDAKILQSGGSSPQGKFLLIRTKEKSCAVRFTSFQRGNDATPPSVTSSGEESKFATYELFVQKAGINHFSDTEVDSKDGRLVSRALKGIGRLAFQTGNVFISCGDSKFYWAYPSLLYFYGSESEKARAEFAPTNWSNIADIDLNNSRLQWFRYDQSRKRLLIHAEDLPPARE